VTTALKAIPQQEFQKYFKQWQHRWVKSSAALGGCVEGDPSQYRGMLAIKSFRELHTFIFLYAIYVYNISGHCVFSYCPSMCGQLNSFSDYFLNN